MKRFAFLLLLSLLSSCGGGGGGGEVDPTQAADVSIDASPKTIDTGDQMTVQVYIYNVNDDGAMIKVRFPVGLKYVDDSSVLTSQSFTFDATPTFNKSDETNTYLVYFLSRQFFGEDNQGVLTFTLDGSAAITAGKIEVDADLDDPGISNSKEFDVAAPNFTAKDSKDIVVGG